MTTSTEATVLLADALRVLVTDPVIARSVDPKAWEQVNRALDAAGYSPVTRPVSADWRRERFRELMGMETGDLKAMFIDATGIAPRGRTKNDLAVSLLDVEQASRINGWQAVTDCLKGMD